MKKQPPKSAPRRECPPVYVWVTPDEKRGIEAMAQATGNSASAYLRRVGLGHEVRSVLDYERVRDLAKVNGDLGRLGGLLKLWLSNDKRLARCGCATRRGRAGTRCSVGSRSVA